MILSSSRRTDIPAFYSEWFINRIAEGFLYVRNPINKKQVSKIILKPELIDCIVFWSKNPEPMLPKLHILDQLGYKYYFQFTLTSYNNEIEVNLPSKNELIRTFIQLSSQIGKNRVKWRYDPILLTNKISTEYHIKYFDQIANKLAPYTDKCIISFMDFYKKCQRNLRNISPINIEDGEKIKIAKIFKEVCVKNKIQLETCAEYIEMANLGIPHGKCIDDKLIEEMCDAKLKIQKDKTQRDICGCVASIDIGAYNTCIHNCLYCYANFDPKIANQNYTLHNSKSPLLIGTISDDDEIYIRDLASNIVKQQSLF